MNYSYNKRKVGGKPKQPNALKVVGLLYEQVASEENTMVLKRNKRSMVEVARMTESTVQAIKRMQVAFEEGGLEQVGKLRWGAGGRYKHKLEMEEIKWLTDPETLKS